MDGVQLPVRRSGRGIIMQQVQEMAAAHLLGKQTPAVSESHVALSRGTGRGKIVEMVAVEKASTMTALKPPIIAGSNGFLSSPSRNRSARMLEMIKNPSLNISSQSSTTGKNSGEGNLANNAAALKETVQEQQVIVKKGSAGTPMQVACNYIRLKTEPGMGVFEYYVKFNPDTPAKNHLLHQHKSVIGSTNLFDGSILLLPKRLPDDYTLLESVQKTGEDRQIAYTLELHFKRQRPLQECMHLYNVIMRRIMKELNYVRLGRNSFDPTAPTVIPQHKLEIWPGYVTAVDEFEDGIMLCLDVSHRVLCQTTVLDIMRNAHISDPNNFKQLVSSTLIGLVVLTRYTNKTYRIDDIEFEKNPTDTFIGRGDQETSYIDYFKNHYGIEIKDKRQPLLTNIKSVPIYGEIEKKMETIHLIPELCYLTGLTDTMRSDFKLMRDVASITRVTPNQRMLALRTFYKNVSQSPAATAILSGWGLTIDSNPLFLQARQLDAETVSFRRINISVGDNGNFDACSNVLLETVDLIEWVVIHTKSDTKYVKSFIECMERNSRPMGISVCRPQVHVLDSDRTETYVKMLQSVVKPHHQMVVIVCPTSRADRYAAIKKVCCGQMEVPSQVINSRTLSNESKNRSIVQKIALQMNCKMGGTLWSVNIPFKNVMICGMDTYHDSSFKSDSVAAFVSSINGTYTKWFSQSLIQRSKEELSNGLCVILVRSVNAYRVENGALPERVIVYRDGVGDGQLQMCSEYEIPQLQAAFKLVEPNYRPKLTFIVVQKRINTRLFAMNNGELLNPSPGCVIDHTITRRFQFDFYLVPQKVTLGTVTPSHYIVLYDSAEFSPDILQRLTFKLCFLYYNWPGPIRVPACCQYAHKLAYLVGEYIRRPTAESLSKKLFYL